jgi:hypothetical protein
MRFLIFIIPAFFLFSSCDPGEIPVEPFDRGDVIVSQVNMDPVYKYQVWFNLDQDSIVKSTSKSLWDIAFDCGLTNHIYLNSALGAKAANTQNTDFQSVQSADGLFFKPDHSAGYIDSLALLNCLDNHFVYVIDRGYDDNGNMLGMIKIQFTDFTDNTLTFRFAKLDGSDENVGELTKNSDFNQVAYSFTNKQFLLAEPQKNSFDLLFSQYTYIFYDPFTYYLVAGVIINPFNTSVAVDSLHSFENIALADTSGLVFSNRPDIIGYDWKKYDFGTATYTVSSKKVFIIRNQYGFYYKLHFVDFYNDAGEKGNPKFEYRKL